MSPRRAVHRALVLAAVLATSLLAAGAAAHATAPQQTGWWTAASTTTPREIVVPVGTDVPSGGMLVQSAADPAAPVAFAAVTYLLPDATAVTKLVLKVVASGSTTGSSLGLCALDRPDFTPASGGAIATAPGYDCAHEIVAAPAADGSYVFNAEPLRTGPLLAVAILPAASLARVVLAAPDGDSLSTRSLARPSVQVPATAVVAPPVAGPVGAAPAVQGLVSAPGVAAPQTPVEIAPAAVTAGPQAAQAASPPSVARKATRGFQHQGLLALLLVGALLVAWTAAGASASRPVPAAEG